MYRSLSPKDGCRSVTRARWNLRLKGRGEFGSLLMSGSVVELMLEDSLGLGPGGSIR